MYIPEFIEKIGLRIPGIRSFFRHREFRNHWDRFVAPGHFYSPIPSDEDIERWGKSLSGAGEILGMELGIDAQKDFAASLARDYGQIPFKAKPADNLRYYLVIRGFQWVPEGRLL